MDSATEKLELGLQRLAKAGDDADLLGLALQSIHGALEDYFRHRLAADPHYPADASAVVLDPRQVQWKDLLDAMQLYGDLAQQARDHIWRMNAARTKVAHGGRYTGGRAELERYAATAQSLIGYTPPAGQPAPAPAQPRRAEAGAAPKAERARAPKPAATAGAGAESPEIPRAVRSTPPVARSRSRMGWSVVLLALALLFGLATFVVLRSIAQTRANATAAPTIGLQPTALMTAAPALPAAPTPLPTTAVVSAPDGLNLRAEPALQAPLVAVLPTGARVAIVGGPIAADGFEWWNVDSDGRRGWCAGAYLAFEQ
jgi:hypothetical protein